MKICGAELNDWLHIMCREDLEQGGCGQAVKGEDTISSEEGAKGDRLLEGKGEKTTDEKAGRKAENGSSEKDEKDTGPR